MTTDDQDETEMRRLGRELFADTGDFGVEYDPSDTRPANQVPHEGSNPAAPEADDARQFVRELFNPA